MDDRSGAGHLKFVKIVTVVNDVRVTVSGGKSKDSREGTRKK
jgi:hypothetical protein